MAKFLTPVLRSKFKKQYRKLPQPLQNKFNKQLKLLAQNYRHPSLRARKMIGVNYFEARIDLHYRFTFEISNDEIIFRTIGPHDEGLGEKINSWP